MKPILFNTEMIRAIRDNRKTVTRRVVKPHNSAKAKRYEYCQGDGLWIDDAHIKDYSVSPCWIEKQTYMQKYAPYRPGDILYVREPWYYETFYEYTDSPPDLPSGKRSWRYVYKADKPDYPVIPGHWRPSIHMPKEAARIFLRVTDVRVERLRDITEEEARAEGFSGRKEFIRAFLEMYPECTEDSHVWVVRFERISKEEAQSE